MKLLSQSLFAHSYEIYNRLFTPHRKWLLSFMFHHFFENEDEIKLGEVHPLQKTTLADFEKFIVYFQKRGYRFISIDDYLQQKNIARKNVLLTVDDGYLIATRILPILEKYSVPATFFITSNNCRDNKMFWWDVLYRERRRRGGEEVEIFEEEKRLHLWKNKDIEAYLVKEFGKESFAPTNDLHRPLGPDDIRMLDNNCLVTIGNHCADHVHLDNYTRAEIKNQMEQCQQWISSLTGKKPKSISYPHGGYNQNVRDVARESGFRAGITVEPRFESFCNGQPPSKMLIIGRYGFRQGAPHGGDLGVFCPELMLYFNMRRFTGRVVRKLLG